MRQLSLTQIALKIRHLCVRRVTKLLVRCCAQIDQEESVSTQILHRMV